MKLHNKETEMQRFEPSDNGFEVYTHDYTDEDFLFKFVKKSDAEAILKSCSFLDSYGLLYNFNNLDNGTIEIYTTRFRS